MSKPATTKKKRPEDPFETWAKLCFEKEIAGLKVEKHDTGKLRGMHDFELYYPDGARGALEVTTCTSGKDQALWKLVTLGDTWIEPSLAGGWSVHLKRDPKLPKNWRIRLRDLIARLEEQGLTSIEDTEFQDELESIGACRLKQGPTSKPGSIHVMPNLVWCGFMPKTADPLVGWLETWVAEPRRRDNIEKLARSNRAHRHLFVGIPTLSDAPEVVRHITMTNAIVLPANSPNLPPEITDIWLASGWRDGEGIRWSAATGWKYFDKLTRPRGQKECDD